MQWVYACPGSSPASAPRETGVTSQTWVNFFSFEVLGQLWSTLLTILRETHKKIMCIDKLCQENVGDSTENLTYYLATRKKITVTLINVKSDTMKLEHFFRKHPVFTGDELTAFLASEGPRNSRTQEALLVYRPRPAVSSGCAAVFTKSFPRCICGNLSGRSFSPCLPDDEGRRAGLPYGPGVPRQRPIRCMSTSHISPPLLSPGDLPSHEFKGVGFESPRPQDRASFDVVRTDRAGLEVRVTGLERTFVDVLSRPDLTGSWEEIWRSLESVEFFDLDKVALYVDLLGNATTAAKVGFFLEQHRDSLMVDEAHLKTFRDRRPRRPHYLERSRRKAGRFVAAWNLVVPEEVYGRSWEEQR